MPTCRGMAPYVADVAIGQYLFVKRTATGIDLVDSAVPTDFCWGISQTEADLGAAVDVETRPGLQSRIVAGAAFAAGAPLKAGVGAAAGKAIAATVPGDIVHALAMEAAGALDEIVMCLTKFEVGVS